MKNMVYELKKTDLFQRDLNVVIHPATPLLGNHEAAASLLNALEGTYREIQRMPLIYESCRSAHLKKMGYRKVVVRNYIIIYRVDDKAKTVHLMRLFHGRQDYEKMI